MIPEDRPQFEILLGELCAGFNVPAAPRVEAYWKALDSMTLSVFGRVVKVALGEHGPEKMPTVSTCWRIGKEIKSQFYAPPPARQDDEPMPSGDGWDRMAGVHLLEHIQKLHAKFRPSDGVLGGSVYHGHGVDLELSPELVRHTQVLRRWAAEWARVMRLSDAEERADGGRELWRNCMRSAHDEIKVAQ